MSEKEKDDFFYVCSLIEFVARQTKNKRGMVVSALGVEGIREQLKFAQCNHCLSFEEVADELIQEYKILDGEFDTITNCPYKIPSFLAIGKQYARIIFDLAEEGKEIEELIKIFSSFISDEISDFKTGVYYENMSYLEESYKAGYLLD